MPRLALPAVKEIVDTLARMIGAPDDTLPTYGVSEQSGRPHIEVSQVYHYAVAERGKEFSRKFTAELDLLLYWVFADITSQMAGRYELRNRRPNQDTRRQSFAKQTELMGAISFDWAVKMRAEHADILILHPFQD